MLQKNLPSVAALSFLGDAVHTLYVRRHLTACGISHAKDLNAHALSYVTAVAQADAYARIAAILTEEEADVYRRAFNTPHINRPKNVSGEVYRTATGFEAVLGMLSHTGQEERLDALLKAAYRSTPLLPQSGTDTAVADTETINTL